MRAVSKAELARLAGVSKAAVTKAAGTFLAQAVSVGKIDVDHEVVKAWLLKKQGKATPVATKRTSSKPKPKAAKKTSSKPKPKAKIAKKSTPPKEPPSPEELLPIELPDDKTVKAYGEMKLKDLVAKFGTGAQFKEWTVAKKNLENIRTLQLKNEEKEGELISRELVRIHLFGALESTNLRLLTDAPKTITARLFSHVKAGGTQEGALEIVRKIISTQIKNVKATAQRVLEDA